MITNGQIKERGEVLLDLGWATIGGRIEDYANLYESHGPNYTYWDIVEVYREEADFVWRGLQVFLKFGADAYYDEKVLKNFLKGVK